MNSTRIVPVTQALIAEALEHYWRSIAMIKHNEEVNIRFPYLPENLDITAEIKTTKEVVETFRL